MDRENYKHGKSAGPMSGLDRKTKKKKKLLSADEFFEIKDSKKKFTGPKSTKGSLGDSINKFREMDDNIKLKFSKGGRAGYKGGKSVKKKGGCAIKGTSPILR